MTAPRLQILVASTRPGRVGPGVGHWFRDVAQSDGRVEPELLDLAEIGLPFLDEPHHPRHGRYVHQHTLDWSATIDRGDCFVFVTPEYNHGYNAVLKNAIDFLHREWRDKPVGFVSYGGISGGIRAVEALKQVVTAVKMIPLFEGVIIPFVGQRVHDGRFEADERLERAATALLSELVRVEAMVRGRRDGA